MRCIEPEGEARANVVSPVEDILPLTHVTGWTDECWLNRAAMLGPLRLEALADAKTDSCGSLLADDNAGFFGEKQVLVKKVKFVRSQNIC